MRSHLVELLFQRPKTGEAVDELDVAVRRVVGARIVDDHVATGLEQARAEFQRHSIVLETPGPEILVHEPEDRMRLAQRPLNPLDERGLAVGQVDQNEAHRPLSRPIRSRKVVFAAGSQVEFRTAQPLTVQKQVAIAANTP